MAEDDFVTDAQHSFFILNVSILFIVKSNKE